MGKKANIYSCEPTNQPNFLAFLLLLASATAFVSNSNFVGRPVQFANVDSTSSLQMISHRKGFKKLGKPADQRKALLRALTTETIRHGRIKTTLVRARAVRKHVDHMIGL